MAFEFVDHNTGITDDSRRRIRRQAAKGHNAGRTLVRVPQNRNLHLRPGALLEKGADGDRTLTAGRFPRTGEYARSVEVSQRVGDSFGCMILPPHLVAQSRSVIQRVCWIMTNPFCQFALQRALSPKAIAPSPWWVEMMFVDEAYYHAIAAACLVAFNNASASHGDTAVVYRHCDQMLHLLNEKLSGNDAVSDATIATVVMASQYERYRGSYSNGSAHLDGLERMIGLRGGIRVLTRQTAPLAYKMFRADLEYSLHLGTRTRLDLSDVLFAIDTSDSLKPLSGTGLENICRGLGEQLVPSESNSPLRVLRAEVMALATLLNDADAGRRPKLAIHGLHHAFLAVGYRLAEIRPLGDSAYLNAADEALYAGLACTVAKLLPGLDGKGAQLPLMAGIVQSLCDSGSIHVSGDARMQSVLLWVLFAANSTGIFDDAPGHDWMLHRAKETVDVLRLDSWEAARQVLDEFPWVHCLQDTAGVALWAGIEDTRHRLCREG